MKVKWIIRVLFVVVGGALGFFFLPLLYQFLNLSTIPYLSHPFVSVLIGAALLYVLALFVSGYVETFLRWMEERLLRTPAADILFGSLGLIIGLLVAFLLSSAISAISIRFVNMVVPFILSVTFGYLGYQVGSKKHDEIMQLIPQAMRGGRRRAAEAAEETASKASKILDTSVIIDGRIADISASGFLDGTLIIPQFVLTELQHIADSSDGLKRTKGRRGLDILRKLQEERKAPVSIVDDDFEDVSEVDMKLVKLAKKLGGKLLTNDFNLNKVAELHNVTVLNINDLANAVKPVVIPGEIMTVHVIKDGKEQKQGVAYLDDGTMIVVEDGRSAIGQTVGVTVTSVLQTSAGRMIFARMKPGK